MPLAAGRTRRAFIFHFQFNYFFGEGSKFLQTALLQLPAAWHMFRGAGFHPVLEHICLCTGRKKTLSCRVRPLVCFCVLVFLTRSARQQKCTCYMDVEGLQVYQTKKKNKSHVLQLL